MRRIIPSLVLCCLLAGGLSPALAADFPSVTEAEKTLTAVPGQPGAPAVVLFSKAEVQLMNYPRDVSSVMRVNVRRKILTEEGKSYGEISIAHSAYYRLKQVKGRTVLPDGREIPLPKDAVFEERRSRSLKQFVTKLVFPAVEVGAILDYSYTVRWDDLFFLEPWYFQDVIPVTLSQISFLKPQNLGLQPWVVANQLAPIQSDLQKTATGATLKLWGENLPAIPDEPHSFPFGDLSSRAMMVPVVVVVGGERVPLMENWETVVGFFTGDYKQVRRGDRDAKKKARELAQGQPNKRASLRAIFDFVRDEIRTEPTFGVGISEDERVDDILKARSGDGVGKALVLQSMFEALKVESELVWAFDRTLLKADLSVANPWWFDTVLVRIELDGETLYLDPGDRSVAFGRLAPGYEGSEAVVVQRRDPPIITLPRSSYEDHLQRSQVKLTVDEEGRVSGHGTLELGGHIAWKVLGSTDQEAMVEAWTESLAKDYEGYDVSGVELEEDLAEQRVRLSWDLVQREEEVLGDEVTLEPTRPVGPTTQPFTLPPQQRRTPVLMNYGRRAETVLTVSFPETWEIDVLPEDASFSNGAGSLEWRVSADEAQNTVEIRTRFDRSEYQFLGGEAYLAVRDLYQQAAKADAQSLVLLAP